MGNSLNLRIHIAVELFSNALNLSFAPIFFLTSVLRRLRDIYMPIYETNIGELYYFINHDSRYPANDLGRLCLDRVALTLTFKYIYSSMEPKIGICEYTPIVRGVALAFVDGVLGEGRRLALQTLQTVSDI